MRIRRLPRALGRAVRLGAPLVLATTLFGAIRSDAQVRNPHLTWPAPDPELSELDDPAATTACWTGLTEATADLDSMPNAIRFALASGDDRLREFLTARLTELIGDDAEAAKQVLAWARAATSHDEIAIFAEALGASEAAQRADVRERVVAMAEDREDVEHQGAALAILETQRSFDERTLSRVVEAGGSAQSAANQLYAIKTIGTVMERGCESSRDCERYMSGLLEIAARSNEDGSRLAAEMIATSAPAQMTPRVLDRVTEILRESPNRWARDLAALAVAHDAPIGRALRILREAFYAEREFCVRVAIFRDVGAAAGAHGLPLMAEMASAQPELQEAYVLFERTYASGVVAWDRVVDQLFERIFLECSMDDSAEQPGEEGV